MRNFVLRARIKNPKLTTKFTKWTLIKDDQNREHFYQIESKKQNLLKHVSNRRKMFELCEIALIVSSKRGECWPAGDFTYYY